MIIGNFSYKQAEDTYTGEIKTLTLLRGMVQFRPTEAKNGKGPDYRVVVHGETSQVELGAAWKRQSQNGREFLSVSLDDPGLARPFNAALMPSDDGKSAILIWSRPAKKAKAK
jgi:uncharacterized protein (DUF736 family)